MFYFWLSKKQGITRKEFLKNTTFLNLILSTEGLISWAEFRVHYSLLSFWNEKRRSTQYYRPSAQRLSYDFVIYLVNFMKGRFVLHFLHVFFHLLFWEKKLKYFLPCFVTLKIVRIINKKIISHFSHPLFTHIFITSLIYIFHKYKIFQEIFNKNLCHHHVNE